MALWIGLALLNGVLIATSRAINGRLGEKAGPLGAALWSHAVGFVFLSLVVAVLFRDELERRPEAPPAAWLGGVLGVAFVALNSHAVPRLGAGRTTGFVVGAQMLASVGLDSLGRPFSPATAVACGGAALIVAGVWMASTLRAQSRKPAPTAGEPP